MSTCLKRINISRTRPFCSWGNVFCLWGCDILCVADPPSLKLPPGSWYVRKIKRIAHDRFIKTPKPLKQLHSKCIDCETQSENHLLYSPSPWATYCIDVRVRAIDIPSVNQNLTELLSPRGYLGIPGSYGTANAITCRCFLTFYFRTLHLLIFAARDIGMFTLSKTVNLGKERYCTF